MTTKDLMTLSFIIRSMVKGLRDPKNLQINMSSFGHKKDGVCFGCAATLAIQQIYDVDFSHCEEMYSSIKRAKFCGVDYRSFSRMESLIDLLRYSSKGLLISSVLSSGNVLREPKRTAEELKNWISKNEKHNLTTENYQESLGPYEDLAEFLENQGL